MNGSTARTNADQWMTSPSVRKPPATAWCSPVSSRVARYVAQRRREPRPHDRALQIPLCGGHDGAVQARIAPRVVDVEGVEGLVLGVENVQLADGRGRGVGVGRGPGEEKIHLLTGGDQPRRIDRR